MGVRGGEGGKKAGRNGCSVAKIKKLNYRDKYRFVIWKTVMGHLWGLKGWVVALALALSGISALNASMSPEIMTPLVKICGYRHQPPLLMSP